MQGRVQGYHTDDLIVYTANADGSEARKLLVQIKHAVAVTEGDEIFRQVIAAAWHDFHSSKHFKRNIDAIALVTGPLGSTDVSDTRTVLEWARHSASADEFFTKVETTKFSSEGKRKKLKAFQTQAAAAANRTVNNDEVFEFLRHFHLLGYDLDVRSGTMHALLHSVIGRHAPANAEATWARVVNEVASANQNAGTMTVETFSEDLRNAFTPAAHHTMPSTIAISLPPPTTARDWDTAEFGPALAVASLIGGWNENSPADLKFIADLTKSDPASWIRTLREVIQLRDPPVRQHEGVWSVRNRGEFWRLLGTRLFDGQIEALRDLAPRVLQERDPRFDLDPHERFAAAVYDKRLEHSAALRHGLAETLALMGAQPDCLKNCSVGAATAAARGAVRRTLDSDDWHDWASVNDILPLLAEASPSEFLHAVERALSSMPCPFDELFAQEGSGIGGSNYMTGLLWALEALAWEEQHLVRVTISLGALASRDPGGQWANRPANSLTTIFLPWLPQTLATTEKKKVAVDALCREYRDVGWKLLLSLMPKQTEVSTGSRKPQWRANLRIGEVHSPTQEEYWEQIEAYAKMAGDLAINDAGLLLQLVAHLDTLPASAASRVLHMVSSVKIASLADEKRLELWKVLSALVHKHRRYHDTNWALPAKVVGEIAVVAAKIAPERPEVLHRVLFSGEDWDLYDDGDSWQEQEKAIEDRRRQAVAEIYAILGGEGVIDFAEKVNAPTQVGYSSAWMDGADTAQIVLPKLLTTNVSARRQFADGLIRGLFSREGWTWVDSLDTSPWHAEEIAQLLMVLPFDSETWRRVGCLLGDADCLYWGRVPVNPYQSSGDLSVAIDQLMKCGRPQAAIDCFARLARDDAPIDRKKAIEALLAGVASGNRAGSLHAYNVTRLIAVLQREAVMPNDELIQVEWAYLPLLGRRDGVRPKALELAVVTDPSFFVELIGMIYRSSKDALVEEEIAEEKRALAQNAYRLLHCWSTVPGTAPDGGFCGDDLKRWMSAVEKSAGESGHLKVALHHAGSVLIHCPEDPDGLWMHRSVAEVLNHANMGELRRGYSLGIYNSRGAHWVDSTGNPERILASKYDDQAEQIENAGYHRLAATLREVAETYRREADRLIAQQSSENREGDEG
ncbi:MAG: hypothetical protein ACTS27_01070 [Phycisphaerales bacterium]